MRLWVVSDLHLRPSDVFWQPPRTPDHDVLVLAGDIASPLRRTLAQARSMTTKPVVLVAGNHEHYGEEIEANFAAARRDIALHGDSVNLLENGTVVIDSVRFIGATLWTGYDLHGLAKRERAMTSAEVGMNDHVFIRCRNDVGLSVRFSAEQALALHDSSRECLSRVLAQPHDGPTVVVTHHAPHPGSINPRWEGDPLNSAFVSDLSTLIERHQPAVWIHGHTYDTFSYPVGRTRLCYGLNGLRFLALSCLLRIRHGDGRAMGFAGAAD